MSSRREQGLEATLDIVSDTLSLEDLERALTLKGDAGSRSRGDAMLGGCVATVSILRVEPNLTPGATLKQQLDAICGRIPAERLREANLQVNVIFNIAVYFVTACATTMIEPATVAVSHDYLAGIQVVAYPVQAET